MDNHDHRNHHYLDLRYDHDRNKLRRISYLKIIGFILVVGVIFGGSYLGYHRWRLDKLATNNSVVNIPKIEKTAEISPINQSSTPSVTPSVIPTSGMLDVPFTTQAPFANWDATHEEACEEASLIMLHHFQKNTTIDSPNSAEKEILDLVDWETDNGYAVDVTVEQLSKIAQKYYGMDSGRIITNVTAQSIKNEISAGRPVIIPAAGKILPNPNFKNGGPNYHMLVVIGYDQNDFITNDPGTRNGKNFRYKYNDLINAIHDWDSSNILNGQKAMLVFD